MTGILRTLRAEDPFILVAHTETEFWAACLWPFPISSFPRMLTPLEVRLLREDLFAATVPRVVESAISHSGSCSNFNALDPAGRFADVRSCGCRGRTHG